MNIMRLAGTIIALTVLVILAGTAWLLQQAGGRKAAVGVPATMALWAIANAVLGYNGFFLQWRAMPPHLGLGILPPLLLGLGGLAVSDGARQLVRRMDSLGLIGFQVYRLVGVLFLLLYSRGFIAAPFALGAGLGDIAVALGAIAIVFAWSRDMPWARSAAAGWNLLGLLDILNALALGILSAPTPFRMIMADPPTALVGMFPFCLLPTFIVPVTIVFHVAIFINLRARSVASAVTG